MKYKCNGLELGKKDTYTRQMLCTDEVIIFVPCATHGHRMIHEQMKHVSNMKKSKDRKDRIRVVGDFMNLILNLFRYRRRICLRYIFKFLRYIGFIFGINCFELYVRWHGITDGCIV